MTPSPTDITAKSKKQIVMVTWNSDHVSEFGYKYLRCHCGCAGCVDERSGVRTLDPASISDEISIENMSLVGNYAMQFRWSDGHETGIYSWEHLLRVCPCSQCGGPKSFDRRPSPSTTIE